MHEIKLIFDDQKEEGGEGKTKLLHLTDLFEYPFEMIVPANCIGIKIYKGDAIDCILLQDLYFHIVDDISVISTKEGKIIGRVE